MSEVELDDAFRKVLPILGSAIPAPRDRRAPLRSTYMPLRPRHAICAALTALAATAVVTPAADASATLRCKSADLRYPFQPGGPNDFGVFKLRIAGGSCSTAHRVAKAWMTKFEANVDDGRFDIPRRAAGFRFTTLQAKAAQELRERGRRGSTTIRFDYRIPNG